MAKKKDVTEPAAEAPEEKAKNEAKAKAQKNALATNAEENNPPVLIGQKGLEIKNLDDLWRFAKYVSASGFAPKGMERPEAVVVAMQMGFELGLTPMAAIQNIAVINGRASVFGDAQLACVRNSGLLESFKEEYFGKKYDDDYGCRVTSKRVGMDEPVVQTFTVADAKKAELWGTNVWKKYPDRMLKFRARGFNLRDNFGDVLRGFKSVEENRDLPKDADIITVTTAPPVSVQDIVDAQPGEPVDASYDVVDEETGEILDIENELKPSPEQVAEANRQTEALKKKVEETASAPVKPTPELVKDLKEAKALEREREASAAEPPPPDDPGPDDSEDAEAKKAMELVELSYNDWTQKGGDIKSLTFLCKARFNEAAPDHLDADEAARLFEIVSTYPSEEVYKLTAKQNSNKAPDRYERKK